MARTSFGFGTPIESDFLNAVAYPKITGLPEDGHLDLLTNANFLNQPGNVVYDFYRYVEALLGEPDTSGGLNFAIKGFRFLRSDGTVQTVADQTITLFNNLVNYVWFNSAGLVQITANPPTDFSVQCAKVTTGSGQITSVTDLRYDYVSLPRMDRYPIFGGTATSDYTTTNNEVIGGLIECRNFTVPAGITVLLRSDTTIRASGDVVINGTIRQNTVQPTNTIIRQGTIGGGPNIYANSSSIPDPPNPIGSPVVERSARKSRGGGSSSLVYVLNAGATQGLFLNMNVNQTTVPFLGAVDGSNLTINAGGSVTLGPSALIDLRGLDSTAPSPIGTWATTTNPAGGIAPNFVWSANLQSSACTPGNCVLQSTQRIEIQGTATINCTGGSEGWALSTSNSAGSVAGSIAGSGSYTYKGVSLPGGASFKYGASGGGGIFMRSPLFSLSANASYLVAPGSMGVWNINTNLYLNGAGAVGNGYILATNTPPTAGTVIQLVSPPVEF
jgi:hypothetical protein